MKIQKSNIKNQNDNANIKNKIAPRFLDKFGADCESFVLWREGFLKVSHFKF
ncbi:MAG: hypothetical protein HYS07_00845 [Chlamydiae bacterium]|nr:hypothetical protein [Chlamydiota bacterium]MBI3277368.1 hypothetical protein [Chlamydiota bacterium]